MQKKLKAALARDEFEIPPVTRQQMSRGTVGKYYREIVAQSNVVRIAADLSNAFPNEAAVNQALRELLKFRETLTQITSDKSKRKKSA